MKDVIALVDLDDTLFQTIRKCPEDVPHSDLVALGFDKDGQPLSYATPRQMRFLDWLLANAEVIPVTARSLDATRRVRFAYDRAIAANGAIFIDENGKIDEAWSNQILEEGRPYASTLDHLMAEGLRVAAERGAAIRTWIVQDGEVPSYMVMKLLNRGDDVAQLHEVAHAIRPQVPDGWTFHVNGTNVAITPPHIGKARAVERLIPALRRTNPNVTIIGVGDSVTDGPFMALCDMAMCPPRSQLGDRMLGGHA